MIMASVMKELKEAIIYKKKNENLDEFLFNENIFYVLDIRFFLRRLDRNMIFIFHILPLG